LRKESRTRPALKWKSLIPSGASQQSSEGGIADPERLASIKAKLQRQGKKVIGLHEGDVVVFGHVNPHLSKLLSQAAEEGWDMYSSSTTWIEKLRSAIAEFETVCRHAPCKAEDVFIAPGIAGCYQILHNALLDAGDEVLAVTPSHYLWAPGSYFSYLQAKVIQCASEETDEWQPSPDLISRTITDKTKIIAINHPNNPTGAIYRDSVLKGIVDVAAQNDLAILSDEIYSTVSYDGKHISSLGVQGKEVPVIVLHSMSKAFMKPGWRVGYMVFHDPEGRLTELKKVVSRASALYGHGSTTIPTPILVAATRAFQERCGSLEYHFQDVGGIESTDSSYTETQMIRTLQERRDFAVKRLNEIPHISCFKPEATFYAFPKLDLIGNLWPNTEEFVLDLLETEGILFTPGHVFGKVGAQHFRTVLTPNLEILEDVFERVENFIRTRSKESEKNHERLSIRTEILPTKQHT